jgi:hypothetical protein
MHKENYRAFCKWAREKKYRLTTDAEKYFVSTHTQSAWDAWNGALMCKHADKWNDEAKRLSTMLKQIC